MKIYKNVIAGALIVFFTMACENDGYIDPITPVEPGPDEVAPTVVITNPALSKIIIPFTENTTDVDFQFEVTDDIEIASVSISVNGTEAETYDSFLDYRRAVRTLHYEGLPVGHHTVEVTATDVSGKATSKSFAFEISNIYEARYEGEIFYMPFEAASYVDLISNTNATVVGTPGFADAKIGQGYAGATDSYLTFPAAGLLSDQFSATFWYKANADPTRAGILVISPPDGITPGDRSHGFRFFREGNPTNQIFKLNMGDGVNAGGVWVDGGAAAAINPTTADWIHLAFTISGTEGVVYINGVAVKTTTFTGISWGGSETLSIMSGAPTFVEFNHFSDLSILDELRLFNKALSPEEVKAVMDGN